MAIPISFSRFLLGACAILSVSAACAADWANYQTRPYGFSMLIPAGVSVREQEWGGGWGGMSAEFEGVRLYGRAKLGAQETDAAIENYALGVIGIPAGAWTRIDQGTNERGWNRYRTFRATVGSKLVFGAYGVGAKGNYLLYLETTAADYAAHRADYEKWYESIRLD